MMRNFYVILFLMSHCIHSNAQQIQALNSTSLSNCTCPGEVWDISTPNKPKLTFPAAGLSKRIMFSKYGFSIPQGSTVNGIQIEFDYNTNATGNNLNDENVLLLYYGNQGGVDKSNITGVYTATNHIVLGGATDTWGWFITPENVNDDGFGFNFKLNSAAANVSFEFLNGALITIYYVNPNGINEFQKSYSALNVSTYNKSVNFNIEKEQSSEIEIYTIEGKKIKSQSFEHNTSKEVNLKEFENGIYTYRVLVEGKLKTGKFILD